MNSFNRFTLWIILASATLTVMAGSIIAPVLNLMREGLEVNPTSVGLIITTHGLFVALFSPLIGILIDRIGSKKPLVFGLILYGLAGGSGIIISSYWVLIFSRAVLGIAVAAILTSLTVLILNLYTGSERNKIMGWRGSANSLGGILWPLVGGFLGSFSWHHPFAVYLLGIPLGVFVVLLIPDLPIEKSQDTETDWSVVNTFRTYPILFVIYSLMFLSNVLLYANVVFLPQRLDQISISNPFFISLFLSTMALAGGVTSFTYGRIRARLSYNRIALLSLILWTGGFSILSQAFSIWLIVPSITLFGIGQGMLAPAVMVWVGETVPLSLRGRMTSYLGMFGYIGQFLSPVLFGPLAVLLGINGVFLVAGGGCALIFLLFLAGMRK